MDQQFLSTPSARRATCCRSSGTGGPRYFYPRPPRGGRQEVKQAARLSLEISIHALREEGDREMMARFNDTFIFLSTPSARRATQTAKTMRQEIKAFLSTPSARRATSKSETIPMPSIISIHALREEGDAARCRGPDLPCYFYPRPPRGGRRGRPVYGVQIDVFLSTPSARRATKVRVMYACTREYFYPRPPRGGRRRKVRHGLRHDNFYPRPPRGGRPTLEGVYGREQDFYPRPPRGGRQQYKLPKSNGRHISIHALREEGDFIMG